MSVVGAGFAAFVVSGFQNPSLPAMTMMGGGRLWMLPALSPIRWFWAFMLTNEAQFMPPLFAELSQGALSLQGYDLDYLGQCTLDGVPHQPGVITLKDAWLANRGWVCSPSHMILLGVIFRTVAAIALLVKVQAHTSAFAKFFAQSDSGIWKLAGDLFKGVVGFVMVLVFLAQLTVFGFEKVRLMDFFSS